MGRELAQVAEDATYALAMAETWSAKLYALQQINRGVGRQMNYIGDTVEQTIDATLAVMRAEADTCDKRHDLLRICSRVARRRNKEAAALVRGLAEIMLAERSGGPATQQNTQVNIGDGAEPCMTDGMRRLAEIASKYDPQKEMP